MSTVYFLGAGASRSAGLPLAGELFKHIAEEVRSGVDLGTKESWERVAAFIEPSDKSSLGRMLSSENIEVVFTMIDLLIQVEATEERQHWQETINTIRDLGAYSNPAKIPELPDRDEVISTAKMVRRDLLELVDHFFGWKHFQFWNEPERLSSLCDLIVDAQPSDCIVTTNWDTCIEHILMRSQKWSPCDGYGFPVKLLHQGMTDPIPLPSAIKWLETIRSIPVLKLHGSYGWRMNDQGKIWLQSDGLLQYLPITPGSTWPLHDGNESVLGRVIDNVHVLLPSFAKTIDNASLAAVWRLSARKLRQARKVVIVGYSLPEADGAMRALFASTLSSEVRCQPPHIVLVSPDPNSQKRFEELLGFAIKHQRMTLEEFISIGKA
ncbi:MAG: SIR2 family protein [Spirochaetia bacterium]|nr:SIR2 family protein [Spirochaetia bacterium]